MICPKCQAENPETRKFCNQCGTRLLKVCLKCKAEILPDDKFCGECGYQLSLFSKPIPKDLSSDEKLAKIQKYLPGGLTEKILSQKGKIEGEHKQVTVMFTDMVAFTPLVEKLGPEEAYALLDQVLEILIHKVHDYEGTVNKMMGDGIMALFGAPIALEDAPQRAIRSAYAIHREMVKFSDKLKQEKGLSPIKMRIGLHTGSVVVGTLGNDLRVEFTAVGDTVNLASRMEESAEPGTTFVTEDIFKLTEGFFRFEALGEKQVKGKETPLKVYRVIAPSTRKTRFDVNAERGLTPFVGRERGLELLWDGFERIKEGRGQAFTIMGEAGVGKSRLLYEFRKAVSNEDVTFLEGKCLSFGGGMAYHPIIDILKSFLDIQENEHDLEIREKVKRGLEILRVEEAFTLPYLLELLSVEDSGIDGISMSPDGRRDRIIDTIRQIILKGSGIRPLVIAIENLHWIDKSSENVLKYLLETIPGARLMLIFTYRPEFVYAWGGKSYINQITLNRLSNREILFMVKHLLGTREIEKDLEKLILSKAEGVPFFVEELLKSLKDLKIIEKRDNKYQLARDVKDMVIPSTIQDMIMAQVDSLPDATRTVLQIGSVIEREFTYDSIKRVIGLPEQILLTHLSALKDSELLYERGMSQQTSYVFRHALIREVVYGSILDRKKKKLHGEIGKAIEEICKDNLAEHYGILAEHFFVSENYAKAAEYYRKAGKKAEKSVSFPDAIAHAERRIRCLEKLTPSSDIQEKVINARTALAFYLFRMNYMVEAKAAIDPIYELVLPNRYIRKLPLIYTIEGSYYFSVEENFLKGIEILEKAVKISEEIGDSVFLFYSNFFLGVALSWDCEFEKSSEYIQKALEVVTAFGISWNISTMKSNLSYYSYNYQGKINLGYDTSNEAVKMSEENGDIFSKAIAYTTHGISSFYKGFFEEAERGLLKGVDLSERIDLYSYCAVAYQYLGCTYFEMGRFREASDSYQKAIQFRKLNKLVPSGLNICIVSSAKVEVFESGKPIDLNRLFSCISKNKVKIYDGTMARLIGEIKIKMGGGFINGSEEWIKRAMEIHTRYGMRWHLANDYVAYADFFTQGGDKVKAEENINLAIQLFESCGAEGWLKHTKVKFSKQ